MTKKINHHVLTENTLILSFDTLPTLDEVRTKYILAVLERTDYNMSRAAITLGIDRRSVYRILSDRGIPVRPDGKVSAD